MSTDIDWRSELDGSFGTGHDLPPGHYVAAGRTAVRRRRAASVAVVAAMVVGVGAAWASGPGGAPRGDAPVATQGASPTSDARPTTSAREARRKRLERMREAAQEQLATMSSPGMLTYAGLVLAPGAGPVLERVPNPMGYTADEGRSVGVRVMVEGDEQYALFTAYPADGGSSMNVQATGDFDGWLAQAVSNQATLDAANGHSGSTGDTSGQPWLVLDNAGNVTGARPNVVVKEMRSDVDLGTGFAQGSTETGTARLVVDGRPEFAVYRIVDGTLEVLPAGGDFPSMDAFIDWARQQYDSGAGLR